MARRIPQYLTDQQYQNVKVLYVEDERFSREKLLRILNRRFSTVYVGKNSKEGLQLYQKYKPELILAGLDEINCFDMIKQIRESNDKVQVILTTANDDSDSFNQSIAPLANHIVEKPIELEALLQAIQSSIHQIQVEKELGNHLTAMDPITHSLNQFTFTDVLIGEIRRAEQFHLPLSLMKIEIDFLQMICECYGKTASNEVLTTTSTIIEQLIRECDIFARLEDDQFLLLMPETDGAYALKMAESIRTLIEGFEFKKADHVTCSIGISEYSLGKSKNEFILESDLALFLSRSQGRNRVTKYSKEVPNC